MNAAKRPQYLQTKGIPLDSIKGGMSEFQQFFRRQGDIGSADVFFKAGEFCRAGNRDDPGFFRQ